jgi:hypothetical protein
MDTQLKSRVSTKSANAGPGKAFGEAVCNILCSKNPLRADLGKGNCLRQVRASLSIVRLILYFAKNFVTFGQLGREKWRE